MFLRQAVPEQLGGSGESLWGSPAGPGHCPDTQTPRPGPVGHLSGLRTAAAAGVHSSSTNTLSVCHKQVANIFLG